MAKATATTDVIASRLPVSEAEEFRRYARERGLPVSVAIRQLVNGALTQRPQRRA